MQNIPKHDDIVVGIPWSIIRTLFCSLHYGLPEGRHWLIGEVDYVAAEVKTCAGITDDTQLIDDINHDFDQHSHWANTLFGLNKPLDVIKAEYKDFRFLAKNNFTFANLFGASNRSIAEEMRKFPAYEDYVRSKYQVSPRGRLRTPWETFYINYSEKHIQECQNYFYDRYPSVKAWQDQVVEDFWKSGYVESPLGFRRRHPLKRNEIINYPIQSASFHVLLESLIEVEEYMERKGNFKSHMAGQIHDSGFWNLYKYEIPEIVDLTSRIMCHRPHKFLQKVKLEIEWEVGREWYDMKTLKAV